MQEIYVIKVKIMMIFVYVFRYYAHTCMYVYILMHTVYAISTSAFLFDVAIEEEGGMEYGLRWAPLTFSTFCDGSAISWREYVPFPSTLVIV